MYTAPSLAKASAQSRRARRASVSAADSPGTTVVLAGASAVVGEPVRYPSGTDRPLWQPIEKTSRPCRRPGLVARSTVVTRSDVSPVVLPDAGSSEWWSKWALIEPTAGEAPTG